MIFLLSVFSGDLLHHMYYTYVIYYMDIEVEAASPEFELPKPIDKQSTLSMDASIDSDEQLQAQDHSAKTDFQLSQKQLDVHVGDQLEQSATPKAATVHLAPILDALMKEPEQTFVLSGMTATTEFR